MRIDFYLASTPGDQGILTIACRLFNKIYQAQHSAYAYCLDMIQAHTLDQLLWTFKDTSFIPHQLIDPNVSSEAKITLGAMPEPGTRSDMLINLAEKIPENYETYDRVLEIVPSDPHERTQARERYKIYEAAGHEVKRIEL